VEESTGGYSLTEKLELTSDLFLRHADAIEKALQEAVRAAILDHKRAGNPIAVSENGRVVIIPPEDIIVDEVESDQTGEG
jgi:hypothetical protein